MATKRFCDICDAPLTPDDDKPYIRFYVGVSVRAQGHIMIMNEQNHVLTDVCNGCKLKVVNEGQEQPLPVATLQSAGGGQEGAGGQLPYIRRVPLPFTPSIPPAPASHGEEL